MGLSGSARIGLSAVPPVKTLMFLYSGMNLSTLSLSAILPSSTSIMTATLVTGLVIDQIRQMVSFSIGNLFSTSRYP